MGSFVPLPFGMAGLVLGIITLVLVTNQKRAIEELKEDIKEVKEKIHKK
jgi:hypothetical protein